MTQSRRGKAVSLLARGRSITEVSDQVGVSRQTIYNWLDDDNYKRQVMSEKARIVEALSSRMISVTDKALQHLEKVTSGDTEFTMARDADIRLKADRLVLQYLRDLYELSDHEVRLTRLEKAR
jgi:transposase